MTESNPVVQSPKMGFYLAALLAVAVAIHYLQPILFPFLASAALAYLGDPLVDRLERRFSRTISVVIVFTLLSVLVIGILVLLLPALWHQLDYLIKLVPEALDYIFNDLLPKLIVQLGFDPESFSHGQLKEAVLSKAGEMGGLVKELLSSVKSSGIAIVAWFANLFLIPVVTFYLLRDWDVLIAKIGEQLPRQWLPTVESIAKDCDSVLSEFIRGQLVVMFLLGCIYSIGLWFVGLELALLIGMMAGLASIVPYMGMVVGITVALIAGWLQFHAWMPMGMIGVVFMVGQALEGTVLTPIFVGDRIGLHPVAVIFAIMVGGQLAGFVGILLALPASAVIMVMLRYLHDHYLSSDFYGASSLEDIEAAKSFEDESGDEVAESAVNP